MLYEFGIKNTSIPEPELKALADQGFLSRISLFSL